MASRGSKETGQTARHYVWCVEGPRASCAGPPRRLFAGVSAREGRGSGMKTESSNERRLVDYLLGALPPEEHESLELRYFSDAALHEELEATADDLIHSYL